MVAASLLFLAMTFQGEPYVDVATARLVALARARHGESAERIRSYEAMVDTRIDMTLGGDGYSRTEPLGVVEYVTKLRWSADGQADIAYRALRRQYAFKMLPGPIPFFDIEQDDLDDPRLDEPWIVPYTLGDDITVVCCGFQKRPALHPFAPNAERYYRYAIADSMEIARPEGTLRLIGIDVIPIRDGPELILGRVWVERTRGDVVRVVMTLVGDRLFDGNRGSLLNKVFHLEANIEYAQIDDAWLPARQLVKLEVIDPWVTGTKIPLRFDVRFRDYELNTDWTTEPPGVAPSPARSGEVDRALATLRRGPLRRVDDEGRMSVNLPELRAAAELLREHGFDVRLGDSDGFGGGAGLSSTRRAGTSWRVVTPSIDSLEAYDEWDEPIRLSGDEDLHDRWQETEQMLRQVAADVTPEILRPAGPPIRVGDLFRFNRVQGVTLGGAYRTPDRRLDAPALTATGRMGLADQRPTLAVSYRLNRGPTTFSFNAGRSLVDVGPLSRGTGFANSINALVTQHDDADYLLATGASVAARTNLALGTELTVSVGVEDHESVQPFDGDGRPNPSVTEGAWARGGVSLERGVQSGWMVGLETLARTDRLVGRAWTRLRLDAGPLRLTGTGGAVTTGDVTQMLFRAGGPATVRGHDYGTRLGESMWSAQAEVSLPSVLRIRPILFGDVGNAGSFDAILSNRPLAGIGVGFAVTLLIAELRLEISHPVNRQTGPRVDLRF